MSRSRSITYRPGIVRKPRSCARLPVKLEISSFVGTSVFWAEHYYGKLVNGSYTEKCKPKEVDVMHRLSTSEATSLNKGCEARGYSALYKPGQLNNHFWNKEDVFETAKKQWKKHFPNCTFLVYCPRGDGICQVLDGPEEFMKKANDLFQRAEDHGWWEKGEDGMKPLEAEWEELCKQFKFERF